MIKPGYWAALDAFPDDIRSGMRSDYEIIDVIAARLGKHRSRNPLKSTQVKALIDHAIATWDDPSIGRDPETYLANLFVQQPQIKQRLVNAGHLLDVDVTVEPDSTDNTPKESIDSTSNS